MNWKFFRVVLSWARSNKFFIPFFIKDRMLLKFMSFFSFFIPRSSRFINYRLYANFASIIFLAVSLWLSLAFLYKYNRTNFFHFFATNPFFSVLTLCFKYISRCVLGGWRWLQSFKVWRKYTSMADTYLFQRCLILFLISNTEKGVCFSWHAEYCCYRSCFSFF